MNTRSGVNLFLLQNEGNNILKNRERYIDPPVSRSISSLIAFLAILGTVYNALLAFVNAHGHIVNMAAAAVCEIAILAIGMLVVILTRVRKIDFASFALLLTIAIISLCLSLANDRVYVDQLRNFGIIAVFTMLGHRVEALVLRRIFFIASILVLAFLILEIASVGSYVAVFQPALYATATRGLADFSLNKTGLFAAALGFQNRFSYGLFSGPRTSSIFLEQVSLAGYSVVLALFVMSSWININRIERILHIFLIALIVTSNNTRTASILVALAIPGYFIFPRMPRFLNCILPVALLIVAAIIVSYETGGVNLIHRDDLVGRLSLTVYNLYNLDLPILLFGDLNAAPEFLDSGYMYIISSSTLAGMVAIWSYTSFIIPQGSPDQKRAAWALGLYIFVWLCIGGTAIFTLKTAGLLWLTIGHFCRQHYTADEDLTQNLVPPQRSNFIIA